MTFEEIKSTYSVVKDIDLQWGEMDAFQHINNIMFFRYFESARMKFFETSGYGKFASSHKEGPILAETKCRFLKQLTFPDRIHVATKVASMGNTSFVMDYVIWSEKSGLAATGESVIVHFNYAEGVKAPIPDELRESISSL